MVKTKMSDCLSNDDKTGFEYELLKLATNKTTKYLNFIGNGGHEHIVKQIEADKAYEMELLEKKKENRLKLRKSKGDRKRQREIKEKNKVTSINKTNKMHKENFQSKISEAGNTKIYRSELTTNIPKEHKNFKEKSKVRIEKAGKYKIDRLQKRKEDTNTKKKIKNTAKSNKISKYISNKDEKNMKNVRLSTKLQINKKMHEKRKNLHGEKISNYDQHNCKKTKRF